jgi:hypothetical protein
MARLSELVKYLEQGYSLQCVTGTRLIPEKWGGQVIVFSQRQETRERVHRPEQNSLAEIRGMPTVWEYGVLFLNAQGLEYRLDNLAAIEEAIQNNTPHPTWGQLPPTSARRTPIGPSEIK